jgi:hypothetical protein
MVRVRRPTIEATPTPEGDDTLDAHTRPTYTPGSLEAAVMAVVNAFDSATDTRPSRPTPAFGWVLP